MSAPPKSLLGAAAPPKLPWLIASVAGHAGAVGLFLALSAFLGPPKIDLEQKPIKASLVRLGKPRDEKLLPRKEEPPAPVPEKAPEAIAVPVAKPDTAVKIPTKDAKAEPKPSKDTQAADQASRKNLMAAFGKAGRAGKVEELEGQADGDPNGDAAKAEGERYFGLLKSVVQRNYDVSSTIAEAERRTLKAEVALWIGAHGEVIDVKVTKPSHNELFDSAVLGAIRKASPFSPPPDHLRDALKSQGVAFVFRAVD